MFEKDSSPADNKVADIASTSFVSLDEDTPVAEAAKALCEQETYSVIVTHDDPTSGDSSKEGTIQG